MMVSKSHSLYYTDRPERRPLALLDLDWMDMYLYIVSRREGRQAASMAALAGGQHMCLEILYERMIPRA